MATIKNSNLLDNPDVKKEIERYKWLESEKAGYDIGYARASEEWLNRFSDQWLKARAPAAAKAAPAAPVAAKPAAAPITAPRKPGRSAKR